jgi:ELWxxDGT repeat protein
MRLRFSAALWSLVLLTSAPAFALEPYLVQDINPIPQNQSSAPRGFISLDNGIALFTADLEPFYDSELWRSDGTAAGTYQLTETCPGVFCSRPFAGVARAGDRLFYLAATQPGNLTLQLWVTGGSPHNTFDLGGPFSLDPYNPPVWVASRRLLFFVADDGEHQRQLWRSDGTRAGTYRLSNHENGYPSNLAELRGKLYFQAPGPRGPALWTSDGTPRGTKLVKDVSPHAMLPIGSNLVFISANPGVALWRSDGTAKGTVQIATLARKLEDLIVWEVLVLAGRYYFTATIKDQGEELWVSDGTKAGTRQLTHFANAGAFHYSEAPLFLPTLTAGSRVVFTADDGVHGAEPWVTDGTPAGTRLLRDLCPGTCWSGVIERAVIGSRLIFATTTPAHGLELWATDGTPAGTRILRDICRGACTSSPLAFGMARLGGELVFGADDGQNGRQLWKTNGTPRGTTRITSFPQEVSSVSLLGATIPGSLLYSARSQQDGIELWRTDGTVAGTRLVRDLVDKDNGGSQPGDFFALGERIYFLANDGLHGRELWTSDGTAQGTDLVHDTPPYPDNTLDDAAILKQVDVGGISYLVRRTSEGTGLWRSDGTEAGTYRLTPEGVVPETWLAAAGNRVFFSSRDPELDRELWTSDGTVQGTRALDLNPGTGGASPENPVAFAGHLYFLARSDAGLVWRSDGSPEGTVPVPFLNAASVSKLLGVHAGRLWFNRYGSSGNEELWSTDGTEAGSRLVREDFSVGSLISAGSRMFLVSGSGLWASDGTGAGTRRIAPHHTLGLTALLGGKLFYTYENGSRELWVSDGTEEGTQHLLDPAGKGFEDVQSLVHFAGWIWFAHGGKIWRTDGTGGGTTEVATQTSYNVNLDPELVPAGNRLFYSAWTPEIGWELWAVDPQ